MNFGNYASNMRHREEREFSIRLHLRAEFPETYQGDEDGFAWHRDFDERLRSRVTAAVLQVLRSEPGFRAQVVPRGADPGAQVDIDVEWRTGEGHAPSSDIC